MRHYPTPMALNEVWAGQNAMGEAGVSRRQPMKAMQRRHNTHFPFVPIPDGSEQKSYSVSSSQLVCFHGYSSIFTLQHRVFSLKFLNTTAKPSNLLCVAAFTVDGVEYKSVDQYYQKCKVKELLGLESEQFVDGSTNNFSALSRDLLRQSGVERKVVDKWRITSGVQVIQKALLEKVRQCQELRDELVKTGDKLIVHTYVGDDFFGAGVPVNFMKAWAGNMDKKKVSVKLPMSFPLTEDSLKNVPTMGKGETFLEQSTWCFERRSTVDSWNH
uniref:NADAR domain-containing protein n=1 Tax=Ditylenchus dipsaci TaxID=166011 RepID=A0A915DRC7_9BILA